VSRGSLREVLSPLPQAPPLGYERVTERWGAHNGQDGGCSVDSPLRRYRPFAAAASNGTNEADGAANGDYDDYEALLTPVRSPQHAKEAINKSTKETTNDAKKATKDGVLERRCKLGARCCAFVAAAAGVGLEGPASGVTRVAAALASEAAAASRVEELEAALAQKEKALAEANGFRPVVPAVSHAESPTSVAECSYAEDADRGGGGGSSSSSSSSSSGNDEDSDHFEDSRDEQEEDKEEDEDEMGDNGDSASDGARESFSSFDTCGGGDDDNDELFAANSSSVPPQVCPAELLAAAVGSLAQLDGRAVLDLASACLGPRGLATTSTSSASDAIRVFAGRNACSAIVGSDAGSDMFDLASTTVGGVGAVDQNRALDAAEEIVAAMRALLLSHLKQCSWERQARSAGAAAAVVAVAAVTAIGERPSAGSSALIDGRALLADVSVAEARTDVTIELRGLNNDSDNGVHDDMSNDLDSNVCSDNDYGGGHGDSDDDAGLLADLDFIPCAATTTAFASELAQCARCLACLAGTVTGAVAGMDAEAVASAEDGVLVKKVLRDTLLEVALELDVPLVEPLVDARGRWRT